MHMGLIILTGIGALTVFFVGRFLRYNAFVPIVSCRRNRFRVGVVLIIQASEGLNTILGTGRSLGDSTIIPLVAQCLDFLSLSLCAAGILALIGLYTDSFAGSRRCYSAIIPFVTQSRDILGLSLIAAIAMMLMSDVDLKSYSNTAYHNEELKSLTRYRFDKVKERAKLKSSVARLVNILFPELEKLVSSLHIAVVYALLSNYPGASYIANANTEELAETLCTASKGRYTKSKTAEIQVAAGVSIGSKMPAKSMELKHTIALIRELDKEISEVESAIDKITSQMDSPIFTIPGIGRHMGAMILAEVGDFSNFASADKLLAYAGLSPSTYQSGQLQNCYAHMEKRGSRYLRYALFNAAKYVCLWCPTFSAYLEKKRSEGKHYNVAISHAAKKLVRLIFAMQRSGKAFLADY